MKKRKYKNSGYNEGGASLSKNTLKEYQPRHYSAKLDLDANLDLLRNRSYDLAINSPVGAAAIKTMTSGVVGAGLELFPVPNAKDLGLTPEKVWEWSRKTKILFEKWANNLACDWQRRNNFFELQRVAFTGSLVDGDCFCLFRRRAGLPTLQLQLIEAARVSNPIVDGGLTLGVEMQKGTHRIIKGVEVDAAGRMTAIHISNKIWNEPVSLIPELKWQRVKIFGEHGNRNVLHIGFDTRPEQFRCEPLLAPVIETLKQIARYSESELTGAIIRSFFSVFFYQPNSNFDLNQILPDEEIDLREYKLGAGTISSLPRGVDVKAIENNNAQSTFESFVTQFLKMTGAAIGLPYEVLMANYQSSYSASRAALIEAEKTFYQRRQAFIADFCQPIYESWLFEMIARGEIDAPGYFENEYTRYLWSQADWRTARTPAIDEVKEVTSAKMRVELGISTREIEAAAIGNDFHQIVEDLKREKNLIGLKEEIDAAEKNSDNLDEEKIGEGNERIFFI